MIRAKNAFAAPLLAVMLLLVLAAAAQANSIVVNVHDDPVGPGDCQTTDSSCSLRQAIATAQPNDTLQLQGSAASPVTYTLTRGTNIVISQNVTVQGNGVGATAIDGSGNIGQGGPQARILRINSGTVAIQHLSINNGIDGNDENFQSCSPCETINANGGGALFNDGGTVALDDVAFNGEATSSNPLGGAVSNAFGSLTMTDVSFTNEHAAGGGALFVRGGNVSGVGVTFENNGEGDFDGGAAYLLGGTVNLSNATIVGNGSGSAIGGGIANAGATLTLVNDTFSGNIRGAIQTDQGATTIVTNTIIGAGFADGTDFACLPSGRWTDPFRGTSVGVAITNDEGNNFDEDGHCGFDGNEDISSADPHLASLADNGGPTRTQALLAGSQAIGNGNPSHCPPNDQRDISRDGLCDIGAFQSHPTSVPATPSTGAADNVTDSSADLTGTINLSGDAGGFHFVWGLSQDELTNSTPVQGAGEVSQSTAVSQTLSGLAPQTTYFYKIVADNASGSTQDTANHIMSFTTTPTPPGVFGTFVNAVTDTTGTVDLTVDPEGTETSVVIKYGHTTNYGQQTGPIDIGSGTDPVEKDVEITGLTPNTDYHFNVVATNPGGTSESGDQELVTDNQVSGTPGAPVTISDSGTTFQGCPTTATIDWGDNSAPQNATPSCTVGDPSSYRLTASHTYATPGHYRVVISYPELDQNNIDQFAQISQPPPGGGGSGPSPPSTAKPSAVIGGPSTTSPTAASFNGSVNPGGLATTAHFEYGLDSKYTNPGTSGPVYDQSTPSQNVGSGSSNLAVSASVSGLVPNALYHVRLVATNSAGTTFGPDATFTTPAAPAPGAPTVAKSFNIKPTQGIVLIEINGKLVPLTQLKQIPSGAVIDTLHGTLDLITSTGTGHKTQTGTFGGAIFKVTQDHSGLTTLTLVENAFKGAPSYASCKAAHSKASAAALSAKTLQLLRGKDNHGKFRTKGRYAAATTRGTAWSVADRCDGTLTKVTQSSVLVNDFVRHISLILHAGHSYLALAKPPRHK
ncbi:MAG: choice-of-anchor Q domain-containing protein [Solirubrobacteraceae bacterium]